MLVWCKMLARLEPWSWSFKNLKTVILILYSFTIVYFIYIMEDEVTPTEKEIKDTNQTHMMNIANNWSNLTDKGKYWWKPPLFKINKVNLTKLLTLQAFTLYHNYVLYRFPPIFSVKDWASFYSFKEDQYKRRRQRIKNFCDKQKNKFGQYLRANSLLFNGVDNVGYCQIAKVASTTWCGHFIHLGKYSYYPA